MTTEELLWDRNFESEPEPETDGYDYSEEAEREAYYENK